MRTLLRNAGAYPRLAAAVLAILLALVAAGSAEGTKTIVFVCQHGVVNSQMAAAYFNRAAAERGLPFRAVSRGIDLYRTVPIRVQDGLALDGLEVANMPQQLVVEDMAGAGHVVAFDHIPAERRGDVNVTYWSGVPLGIDDYEATRDQIVRRIDRLISALATPQSGKVDR